MQTKTKKTIDAYNKNAANYAKKFDNYEVYQNKISEFQHKYIAPKSTILDLGCGPGNNIKTILAKDNTCLFTGVDLAKEFINIAKKKFPQFDFFQQDIRSIKLKHEYDITLASFCIVHLTNEETSAFLNNISNIVKNDGHLYLSYMNGENSGFESTSFSKEEIFFNYYQDQFIIELLLSNNFKVLEISKADYLETNGSTTTDTFIYAINKKII
ncbi:MAG: class I SAM-dependent methyltransferase [Desulfotalea sp.]